MKKTYISSLMVALVASTPAVWAQFDEFSAFDDAEGTAAPEAASMDVATVAASAQAVAVAPEKKDTTADVLARGKALFDAGEYDAARAAFKVVLANEPYNKTAMKYIDKCAARIFSLAKESRRVTRNDWISAIEEVWTPEYAGSRIEQEEDDVVVRTPEDDAKDAMLKMLKDTVIADADLDDVSIQDAVLFLGESIRTAQNPKGINMVLIGLRGADQMGAGDVGNNIRISIREMSLYQTLNAICEQAGLKYEIEPNVVYIMPFDTERQVNMVEKMIKVSKSVGEKLAESASPDAGGGMDEMNSLFGDAPAAVSVSGPVPLNDYISKMGIPCPRASVATYFADSQQVQVRNTAANIKKIEEKLKAIQNEIYFNATQQVQIEAKFVEFSEGAYEEVGLDWNISGSGTVGGFSIANDTPLGASAVAKNGVTDGALSSTLTAMSGDSANLVGSAYRTGSTAFEAVTAGILSSMGTDSLPTMVFDRGDVAVALQMLEQEGTADILSSPKVTTMSGEEAIMRVVEIHRYPQDYDVETGQRTAPIVKPEDWEDFDLGVVLRVMPDINDNETITMKLDPEIRKFKGFEDYSVAINSYVLDDSYGSTTTVYGDGSHLFAHMPYFEIRSVSTRVTVADGHTVVMGGLMDERSETFRDQVPVLGDLPYVGRLFRHEGTRSEKKNLVIYVKATQVDVRGMSHEESELARTVSL